MLRMLCSTDKVCSRRQQVSSVWLHIGNGCEGQKAQHTHIEVLLKGVTAANVAASPGEHHVHLPTYQDWMSQEVQKSSGWCFADYQPTCAARGQYASHTLCTELDR
jgi:hypothetical protein